MLIRKLYRPGLGRLVVRVVTPEPPQIFCAWGGHIIAPGDPRRRTDTICDTCRARYAERAAFGALPAAAL